MNPPPPSSQASNQASNPAAEQASGQSTSGECQACRPAIILMGIMMVSTGMLVRWAMHPHYGYDESWHAAIAYISPLWIALQTAAADVHPLLYYLMLRPLHLLGDHPFFLRLLSIIPALLTLPLLYLLLRRLRIGTTIALTTVLVLAASFSFNDTAVTVRSYALTTFLLVGALWFWVQMLPGGPRRPSRVAAVSSLALFTTAFWCLYAAALSTSAIFGATLAVMAMNPQFRRQTWANWRHHSSWPEWSLFLALHGVGVAWFLRGRSHEVDTPIGHVTQWFPADGQSAVDYLTTGLRHEMALFTPLTDVPNMVTDIGLVAILLLIVTLTRSYLRRGDSTLAILALTPLLLTGMLALLGLFGIYPFGGELRHQYLLFPFLLLLLPLALHRVWPVLGGAWPQRVAVALVVGIALHASFRAHQENVHIGDTTAERWADDETIKLFSESSDVPVLLPRYKFYPILVNLITPGSRYRTSWNCDDGTCVAAPQGMRAVLNDWPEFQQHRVWLSDRGTTEVFKSRDWLIGVLPDDSFFERLRGLMTAAEITEIRIVSPAHADDAVNHDALRAIALRHGFRLTDLRRTRDALIWQLSDTDPGTDQASVALATSA